MKNLLKKIRVIDLTRYVAGPHSTMMLAELGADVIKIEKIDGGDELRNIGPKINNISLWSAVLNRSKRSLSLDIRKTEGREIFLKLISEADVLIENFKPGVMEKLKLDWNTLSKINKQLIFARISGYGRNLPDTDRQAFDAVVQAETGYMAMTGMQTAAPSMAGTVILDYATGLNITIGILAALLSREKSGKGRVIETSLAESALSMTMGGIPDYYLNGNDLDRIGNRDRFTAPANTFKAKDGYIHIMAGTNDRFEKLLKIIGKEDLINNPKFSDIQSRLENIDELESIILDWTENDYISNIGGLLTKSGIPWGVVRSLGEFLDSPLGSNRTKKIDMNNGEKIYTAKFPITDHEEDRVSDSKMASLGQHNEEILKNELGYSKDKIKLLRNNKIIGT